MLALSEFFAATSGRQPPPELGGMSRGQPEQEKF
jgi:hypothetical protein